MWNDLKTVKEQLPKKEPSSDEKAKKDENKDVKNYCKLGVPIIKLDVEYELNFGDKLLVDDKGKIIDDPIVELKLEMNKKLEELSEKFKGNCADKKEKIKEILSGLKKKLKGNINIDSACPKGTTKGGSKCYPLFKRNRKMTHKRRKKNRRGKKLTRKYKKDN